MNTRIADIKAFLSKDKRKSERLVLPIKIFYNFHPLEEWCGPLLIDDISGYGLKFTADSMIDQDATITLKIIFPDETVMPVVVEADVCWAVKKKKGYSAGVKFHKMNYSDRKRFVGYLSEKILLKYLK